MARRILAMERSPLAKNVYSMILSKVDRIELTACDTAEVLIDLYRKHKRTDLIIIDHSTIGDQKKELYNFLKDIEKNAAIPCLLFIRQGSRSEWQEFCNLKSIAILERPFYPESLIEVAREFWGNA